VGGSSGRENRFSDILYPPSMRLASTIAFSLPNATRRGR
jgi:hypothetical protein